MGSGSQRHPVRCAHSRRLIGAYWRFGLAAARGGRFRHQRAADLAVVAGRSAAAGNRLFLDRAADQDRLRCDLSVVEGIDLFRPAVPALCALHALGDHGQFLASVRRLRDSRACVVPRTEQGSLGSPQ